MELSPPPTIIVVHRRENRAKCTVEPLRGRAGFEFRWFGDSDVPPLRRYVRLGIGGPPLSIEDAASGLLILDATWHRAQTMEKVYASVPARSLPGWKTADRRRSNVHADPPEGLATIEAIYAAYSILGRPTDGLLHHYHWRDEFLEINRGNGA